MCMGKSENQKAKNKNANDLHKNHQKHNEPLLVIRVDEEGDDVDPDPFMVHTRVLSGWTMGNT